MLVSGNGVFGYGLSLMQTYNSLKMDDPNLGNVPERLDQIGKKLKCAEKEI